MIIALFSVSLLCGLLTLGIPMVVSIGFAVIINLMMNDVQITTLPGLMNSGLSKFVFIALPMFVLMGSIMNAGGVSARLFNFAKALVGAMRGGLAQVNVLTSMFFGGMIGSSTADLAGTGSIVIPAMKKEGYSGPVSAAVTASSSGLGPLIPPSTPMILYSAVTGTSLGALFLAGLVPGIIFALLQMSLVSWLARRHGWAQHGRFALREVGRTGLDALLPFCVPGVVVGGFILGIFTPTESSVFAVAFALFLSVIVYRKLNLRSLYRVFANAVQLTGELKMITALSLTFGWALANAGVPQAIVGGMELILGDDSQFMRLLLLVLLAIIAGMFLDPLIPVLIPIILPVLLFYQIDLTHFGVLMVICVVIGQMTPPMAIALVITSKLANCDQIAVFRAAIPFIILMILFLLLIMLVPSLATWLPSIAAQGR